METTQLASLATQVRMLPAQGAGRGRRLHRLTDLFAAAEAESALRAATGASASSDVLALARDVWNGGRADAEPLSDDVAARQRLRETVSSPSFLSVVPDWVRELREIASERPDTGACTLATALQLWAWTMNHFHSERLGDGDSTPQAVDELADALCPLLAARCLVLEVAGKAPGARADRGQRADLCHVHAAHTAALMGAACAELVFGYRRHLVWDAEGCMVCYGGDELDALEGLIPGIATSARAAADVVEADGSHAAKAGPCARFDGLDTFTRLRSRLDGCLSGARLAKERAAAGLVGPADGSGAMPATAATGEQ